jgi:hypothetical protein
MNPRIFSLQVIPEFDSILGRLGYNKKKTLQDDSIFNRIKDELISAQAGIHQQGLVLDMPVEEWNDESVRINKELIFKSHKLSQVLKDCKIASIMACTIGNQLREEAEKFISEGQMTEAVILDAIGSESVEAFADYMTGVLTHEKALLGLKLVMRYSPGYGDWKTDIHPALLKFLGADKIGLTCDPGNYVLVPEKSITAVIGWK